LHKEHTQSTADVAFVWLWQYGSVQMLQLT